MRRGFRRMRWPRPRRGRWRRRNCAGRGVVGSAARCCARPRGGTLPLVHGQVSRAHTGNTYETGSPAAGRAGLTTSLPAQSLVHHHRRDAPRETRIEPPPIAPPEPARPAERLDTRARTRFTSAKIVSAHNSSPGALTVLSALAARTSARPKRTLLFVLLFVVVAGVVGGPVAGSLEPAGGFADEQSGSARAEERIEGATGAQATPGVVVLLREPGSATEVRAVLEDQPGIVAVSPRPTPSRDGDAAYLTATLAADADEGEVVERAERALRGRSEHRPRRRRGRVRADRRQRVRGPRARRDARLPAADPALAAVLPRPRHDPAAGGRADDDPRHVPRADRGEPGLFAVDLRAEPGDRARAGTGDRLHAVPRPPLPRGARARGRGAHDDADRRPDRRLQRRHRGLRADHADRVPARLPAVDGDRRRRGGADGRAGLAGDRARHVRALGRQAGRAPAPAPAAARAGRLVPAGARRDAPPASRGARHRGADAACSRCPHSARSGRRSTRP